MNGAADGELAIVPPPPLPQSPANDAASIPRLSPQPGGATPAGGTWAVMVGIDDYPQRDHDLRVAGADALLVDTALSRMGVATEQRRLLHRTAPVASIERAIDWLAAHAGPDAVAVFFYAGHVRKLDGGTEALVGSDGRLLSDADLARLLSRVAARRSWVVIAGCFGAGFVELRVPGRVLTGAAAADSLAYENTALGHSYLAEYMVRQAMIEGKAPPTVQGAFAYAEQAIAVHHPGRQPVQLDWGSGPLDLRPPSAPASPPGSGVVKGSDPVPGSGEAPPSPPPAPPASTTPPTNCVQIVVLRPCTS